VCGGVKSESERARGEEERERGMLRLKPCIQVVCMRGIDREREKRRETSEALQSGGVCERERERERERKSV
jgi:hypothetical protein